MIECKNFQGHLPTLVGKRNKFDNTIYTFDIETTSYIILDGKIFPAIDYLKFTEDEQKRCEFRACMYEWSFSIENIVYYRSNMARVKMVFINARGV